MRKAQPDPDRYYFLAHVNIILRDQPDEDDEDEDDGADEEDDDDDEGNDDGYSE
ncbi:MAG: hypothetical protein WCD47_06480 [Candidatus Sulfotelmatobacter sp.]